MNKITELMIQRLTGSSDRIAKKSANIIKTFTDAIEDIDEVNAKIDVEVEEATNIVIQVEKQRDKLADMKQHNLNIKEKIQNIIS